MIRIGKLELTMERSGEFKPAFVAVPGHPGKCDLPTADVYRYHCEVKAMDTRLSPEGFIMDNARIQSFFEACFNGLTEMSCERMASHAARNLGLMLLNERIEVTCVTTKIGGSNGAWLTARWVPTNRAPRFLRRLSNVIRKSIEVTG